MNNIDLSPEEKAALELRHKKCRDVKECYRINAVLLRAEGWTISMIAQALRIHESTVTGHINDYVAGKLKISSGGSSSLLSESQAVELLQHLTEKTYLTTQEIIIYIKEKYNISYSIPGMNKWLHRNGFGYKKPKGYPRKASKEQQEKFIEHYGKLKEGLADNSDIYFMDSCHPSMATKYPMAG